MNLGKGYYYANFKTNVCGKMFAIYNYYSISKCFEINKYVKSSGDLIKNINNN